MDDLLGLSINGSSSPSNASSAPPRPPPMGAGSNFDALTRGQPSRPLVPSNSSRTASPARQQPATRPAPPAAHPSSNAAKQDAFASLFSSAAPSTQSKQPAAAAAAASAAANSSSTLAARQQSQAATAPVLLAANDPFSFNELDDDVFGLSTTPTFQPSATSHPNSHATNNDEDDILGLLGKPPDEVLRQRQAEAEAKAKRAAKARQHAPVSERPGWDDDDDDDDDGWGGLGARSRERNSLDSVRSADDHLGVGSASGGTVPTSGAEPAPHLIGQVVEMGFDPVSARSALIRSDGDVQGALDSLLGGSSSHQSTSQAPRRDAPRSGTGRTMTSEFAAWQAKQSQAARTGAGASSRHPGSEGQEHQDWEEIQSQLVDKASQLGTAAFARATSFWSTAKAQVAKALDEQPPRTHTPDDGPAWARQSPTPRANRDQPSPATTPSSSSQPRPERNASPGPGGSDWAARAAETARAWQRKLAAAQGVAPKAAPAPDVRPKWMQTAAEQPAANEAREVGDTRPKWMQAAANLAAGESVATDTGFYDDDAEPGVASSAALTERPAAPALSTTAKPTAPAPRPNAAIGNTSARLRVEEDASAYVSPARRRRTAGSTPGSGASTPAATAAPSAPTTPREAVKPVTQRAARSIIADPAGVVTKWQSAKKVGNEAFGRGAYGEADQAYTQALDLLSAQSLRRVVVLNNRAACRLHNGDAPGAMADTQTVLRLVAGGAPCAPANQSIDTLLTPGVWSPVQEAPLPPELAQDVVLTEAWGKALMRYAQAAEAAERYVSARKAWIGLQKFERMYGAGQGAAMRSRSAAEGLVRCDSAIKPATAQAAPKPKATAPTNNAAVRAAGERASAAARAKFREATTAKEGEDAQRLALKDGVDGKITLWKAGKENNIRALLGSVDTVVGHTPFAPPKVGMHQLVTDAQVKKAYMKTISRLHPDKLATATDLEHRMLAAGAFAALNDAWVAHTN